MSVEIDQPVYLDWAADAPRHAATAEAMRPWLTERFGNPSGSHQVARRARAAVDDAREVVASFLGAEPGGVIFTSGGTEADNLAVLGPLASRPGAVVVSAVEHPAVIQAARASGRETRIAGVDALGVVDPGSLKRVLDGEVAVVSIQLVNHETGVIQPLAELAPRIRKWAPRAVFHTDAVQGAAWLDLAHVTAGADLISISGHKIGGPQGVGVLAVRGGAELAPITHGGGQERERRSGSHNVAAIAGLGAAVAAIEAEQDARRATVEALRDRLGQSLIASLPEVVWTAQPAVRAPGHLHLRFGGLESEALLFKLDESGVCASAGAACASGALEPSPVLLAMGVAKRDAGSSLRLTLGPSTTEAEVDQAVAVIAKAVRELRAEVPA
ncbi:MAG: cysteine desulfurase [Acidimicrobiales bacterium]|nr:cysteine desulfurase [Acidimicrobiales bacterium]